MYFLIEAAKSIGSINSYVSGQSCSTRSSSFDQSLVHYHFISFKSVIVGQQIDMPE